MRQLGPKNFELCNIARIVAKTTTITTLRLLRRAHWAGGADLLSFYSPHPDTSLRNEFPDSGLVNRGNVSVVATSQSCSSISPICREMARLSRPRASVCKFPTQRNYALTQVSATGFETGTVRYEFSASSESTTPH